MTSLAWSHSAAVAILVTLSWGAFATVVGRNVVSVDRDRPSGSDKFKKV